MASGPVVVGSLLFALLAAWCLVERRVALTLAVLGIYLGLLDGYLKLRLGSPLITLGRDVLIAAIAAGALLRARRDRGSGALPPLSPFVFAFCAIVLVELANPNAPRLVQGLAGVRTHLEFVPLFFLGFAFIRSERQLRALITIIVVCAAAGGVVSLVQSLITPDQLAAWGPGYRERILGEGYFAGAGRIGFDAADNGVVRPFGLGSDIGAGGLIAALALPGVIALIISGSLRARLLYAPLALGIALAVVTSGSRASTLLAAVSVLAFGAIATISRSAARAVAGLVVATALVFGVAQWLGPDNPAKNRARSVAPDRVLSTFSNERLGGVVKIEDYVLKIPLGLGVGSVGPALAVSGGPPDPTLNSETLWNFLMIETGLIGLAIIVAFMLRLLWLAATRIRRRVDPEQRLLLAAIAAPLSCLLVGGFGGPTTVAVPSGPFLWLVAGVLSYWLIVAPDAESRALAASDERVAGPVSAPAPEPEPLASERQG